MFTGIVESLGTVQHIIHEGTNLNITIKSALAAALKIDQSVAHNGICLTVTDIFPDSYSITAVKETILKTNIADWRAADEINLERAMKLGDRLDGHIVQGHVDQTGVCLAVEEQNGSWLFTFGYEKEIGNLTIEKGSICVNGVSLTVVDSASDAFSVAIIPYTYENTQFKHLYVGARVNLEFDVLGKYIAKLYQNRRDY